MRHEYAVSEVIGAVLLIGVVMISMVVIGVIMFSTPPPEKTPKASLTAYCVRCDFDDNYEIIIYHGGGDSMKLDEIKFYLDISNGTQREIFPWFVYDGCTPEDCMFSEIGESGQCPREDYNPIDIWKSGQTFRFREWVSSPDIPIGIDIRYFPYKSPMVKTNFKDQIKDSFCIQNGGECRDPNDELIPILIDPGSKVDGTCQAQFKYHVYFEDDKDQPITAGQNFRPWNFFTGEGYIGPVSIDHFNNTGSDVDIITVSYNNKVRWLLGRTKSKIARCE